MSGLPESSKIFFRHEARSGPWKRLLNLPPSRTGVGKSRGIAKSKLGSLRNGNPNDKSRNDCDLQWIRIPRRELVQRARTSERFLLEIQRVV